MIYWLIFSVGKNQNLVKGKSYAHAIGVKYLSLFPQQVIFLL